MKKILSLLAIMACLYSCRHPLGYKCDHAYINVINNSSSSIYVYDRVGIDPVSAGKGQTNHADWYLVRGNHGQNDLALRHDCLGTDFFKANDTSVKQVYFLFDSATIYRTPTTWDSAYTYNLYLRKYTLNYHDIDSMGWKITYP